MLPAPLSENAAANPTGAPSVTNYYVTPLTGYTDTLFTYYATYVDLTNRTPQKMQVEIDGQYAHDMAYHNGTVSEGATYKYSTKLDMGTHNFTIVYRAYNDTTDSRTNVGWYPYVQWTTANTTTLSNGNHTPSAGDTTMTFTYFVTYSNTWGYAPSNLQVVIDGTGHKMHYVNGSNTTGALYQYKTKLGSGSHDYYFMVGDFNNTIARLPSSGYYDGPYVKFTGWRGPWLTGGSVSPTFGHLKTMFNYTVTYTHGYIKNGTGINNGTAPFMARVYIDNGSYPMTHIPGNYTNGVKFWYTTTLQAGNHDYYFDFNNHSVRLPIYQQGSNSSDNYTLNYFLGPLVSPHTVSLRDGKVSPGQGYIYTTFRYSVTYYHMNGTAPTSAVVYIDGTPYNMTHTTGDYSSGVTFTYDTKLGGGSHEYYFEFKEGNHGNTFPDKIEIGNRLSGPRVISEVLALYKGWVSPSQGYLFTTFNYTVYYWGGEPLGIGNGVDDDFDAEKDEELYNGQDDDLDGYIDEDCKDMRAKGNGKAPTKAVVYIDDKPYNMTPIPGNYSRGVKFWYTTTLPGGQHKYYFYFELGNASKKIPMPILNNKTYYDGPYVNPTYTALMYGKVTPKTGDTKTTFTYSVTYSNYWNYPPYWVQVYIDNQLHNMTYVSGSNKTGAIYEYKTKLGEGTHDFYFNATTSGEHARDPGSGVYGGPTVVKSGPALVNGKVIPSTGYLNTLFNYTVTYTHTQGSAPSTAKVFIDDRAVSMQSMPGNYTTGVTYWYTTNLSAGQHKYRFEFTSGTDSVNLPFQGDYSGPFVNSSLDNNVTATVQPSQGDITTIFTYTLSYSTGSSILPLKDVRVVIDNVTHNMTRRSGTSYKDVYEYNTTLSIGDHDYYFTVNASGTTVKIPSTGKYPGPKVVDKPPKLSTGQVTPTVGYANSTIFNFTVRYSDLEGKSPTLAQVYVNGSYQSMTYVSGSNKTGALYLFGTTLWPGNYQFHFKFSDGTNIVRLPTAGEFPGPAVTEQGQPINYPPELKNGTVSPSTGNGSTLFTYSVYYTDKNGDGAGVSHVVIDGFAHNMTGGTGLWDGWQKFTYQTKLSVGTHNYYFYFKDTNGSAARLPLIDTYTGPTVLPPPNQAPTLYNGSVTPASGNTSTKFTYTVWYRDPEGDKPVIKYVYIDGYPHTMLLTNDADHKNGARYTYTTYLDAGNHTYYFKFNDSKSEGRYPKTGVLSGPIVVQAPPGNNPPRLYYGRVYPTSGTPKTNFTYYVYYYDADGDKPTQQYIVIDGTKYVMKYAYGGTGSSNGQGLYTYSTRLSLGNHTYYFIFSDGKATVRLPESGTYSGPVVTNATPDHPPSLWYGKVDPYKGNTSTTFTYSVYYKDPEGKAPTLKIVYIDGLPKVMSYISGSYTTGALFQYQTTLAVGSHNFYFLFSDGSNYVRLPYGSFYYGPVVTKPNRAPVADAGNDQESTTGTPKTLYFDGSGSSDPDGDRLTYFWDFGDGGYAYGVRVYHIFHGVGTYNVSLTVSDGKLKDTDYCSVKIKDSGQGKTQGKAPTKRAKIDGGSYYWAAAGLIAGASILCVGAVVGGTEWGLYAFFALFLPLYVRIKGKKILDNFTRGKIYGYIIANPGDHYNSIRTSLKLKNGALAYHLKTLERENFIKSQTDGKYKRFYPYEMKVEPKETQLTTMRKNIVEQIREEPGISQNEISEKMGVSHQAISYHLRTLVQLGAVEVEKKGRKNKCYPGPNGIKLTMPDEDGWT